MKPKPLIGALEINNHLDNAEHILAGKVPGPEHLLPRGNSYYASLHNGNVVRIDGEHITFITKFGKPCDYPTEEHICGRPVGLAFDTQGDNLIVVDAYYGLWEVNLKNNEKKQLVKPEEIIGVNVSIIVLIRVHQKITKTIFRFHVQRRFSTASLWLRMATFSSHLHHLNSASTTVLIRSLLTHRDA